VDGLLRTDDAVRVLREAGVRVGEVLDHISQDVLSFGVVNPVLTNLELERARDHNALVVRSGVTHWGADWNLRTARDLGTICAGVSLGWQASGLMCRGAIAGAGLTALLAHQSGERRLGVAATVAGACAVGAGASQLVKNIVQEATGEVVTKGYVMTLGGVIQPIKELVSNESLASGLGIGAGIIAGLGVGLAGYSFFKKRVEKLRD
jgi:hypothetical protein